MRKSGLIQHYKDKQVSFHLYFKSTFERQGIEEIHQLRLSIKKLRTILSLMELVSHGMLNKKGYFSLLSKLFDAAGEVREAQVSLRLIEKSNAFYLMPYKEYLKETQSRANIKLLTTMQAFDFKSFEILNNKFLQEMKGITSENAIKKSAAYVLKKIRKVYELKNHLPDNRKLHKIRIHLKAVFEIMTIMNELNSGSTVLEKLQNKIKSIDKKIGKWHDYVILLTSLNYFTNQILMNKNVRYLINLIRRVEYQQEIRQQNILRLINKYITQRELKLIEKLF